MFLATEPLGVVLQITRGLQPTIEWGNSAEFEDFLHREAAPLVFVLKIHLPTPPAPTSDLAPMVMIR
jgi:hypothetical protein